MSRSTAASSLLNVDSDGWRVPASIRSTVERGTPASADIWACETPVLARASFSRFAASPLESRVRVGPILAIPSSVASWQVVGQYQQVLHDYRHDAQPRLAINDRVRRAGRRG